MKIIETERWVPSKEDPSRSEYIGQRTGQEVFEELRQQLENMGCLPDEYFLLDQRWENGREIPSDQWELNELTEILRREGDFDLLTVMLGTNDLLTMVRSGSAKVAVRMEQFLTEFLQVQPMVCRPEQVLLIAPPSTALGEMAPSSTGLDEACRELGDYYADIAEKLHLHFVNASVWPVELGADGVHMTAKGHQIFAEELKKVLADIF